jgi:DNA-binding beta-propeller fold protein YncE
MKRWLLAGFAAVLAVICGCSDGRLNGTGGGAGPTGIGQLYVATNTGILRFNNALGINGNAAPAASITGSATTLSAPQHLLVDPSSNRLYVADHGASSILIYESASTVNGNVAPSRTISGSSTLLAAPHELAFDPVNNLLYVGDGTQILVFQSASTINGNVPPVHNISMGFAVGALFLDLPNNRLYVADTSGSAIDRLEGASLQDGTAVIAATISGANTGLARPQGLAFDSSGRLIVSNAAGPSITIYANPATASGNVVPAAAISGSSTQLAGPDQIVFSQVQNNGELYVADNLAGGILIYSNMISASGNVVPSRTVLGTATGLVSNGVNGVALDTTR